METNKIKLPDGFNDITINNKTFTVFYESKPFEKTLPFTLKSLTYIVSKLPCNGMKLSKNASAEKLRMPPLILTFYKYIFKYESIPIDLTLVDLHISQYYNIIDGGQSIKLKDKYAAENTEYTSSVVNATGVRNRILRMYPSLIRDFHFYLLCYESGKFSEVKYSLVKDFQGYDLIVTFDNKKLLVRLLVDTLRSNYYNSLKYNRHDLEHNIFDLKINLASERKTGEFYLYNNKHIQLLINHFNGENGR
jgi:hypothetical protein